VGSLAESAGQLDASPIHGTCNIADWSAHVKHVFEQAAKKLRSAFYGRTQSTQPQKKRCALLASESVVRNTFMQGLTTLGFGLMQRVPEPQLGRSLAPTSVERVRQV
jgi:hypothetical protein